MGIGARRDRQTKKGWGELGKPTAISAATLLVKLADGHFASFAFCRALGATMGAEMAG
jgi:hypothetical protein